jgi:hypothetical protein
MPALSTIITARASLPALRGINPFGGERKVQVAGREAKFVSPLAIQHTISFRVGYRSKDPTPGRDDSTTRL